MWKQHWPGSSIPLDINSLRVKCNYRYLAADACLERSQELLLAGNHRAQMPEVHPLISPIRHRLSSSSPAPVLQINVGLNWHWSFVQFHSHHRVKHHRSMFHWYVCTFPENLNSCIVTLIASLIGKPISDNWRHIGQLTTFNIWLKFYGNKHAPGSVVIGNSRYLSALSLPVAPHVRPRRTALQQPAAWAED